MPRATSPSRIQAIDRASQIVQMVCERGSVRVLEVSEQLSLERTTAHRYLVSLEKAGFLARDGGEARSSRYRLGPVASTISAAVRRDNNIVSAARAALQEIADDVGATIVLGVRVGTTVVVTDVVQATDRALGFHVPVGHVVPPDGAQSILALTDATPATIEAAIAPLPEARRRAVRTMLKRAIDGGVLIATVESARVIAVPLSQNGTLTATLAALVPAALDDGSRAARLLLEHSGRLSRSLE